MVALEGGRGGAFLQYEQWLMALLAGATGSCTFNVEL